MQGATDISEIPWIAPQDAVAAFADDMRLAWLDSAADDDPRSEWSFVCLAPRHVVEADGERVTIDGALFDGTLPDALEQLLGERRAPSDAMAFTGGLVGYLGYGAALGPDRVPSRHATLAGVPDASLGLYEQVIGFDHRARRCFLAAPVGETGRLRARLQDARPAPAGIVPRLHFTADPGRAEYDTAVAAIRALIEAGDIFQANLTARHIADAGTAIDPLAIHRALRARSPAPFAALCRCGPDLALCSASPERFIRLDGASGMMETRPIKGTRPRGDTELADRALAAELLASAKDHAENLMIVDLMRNDLGRVAALGSVDVERLAALESFASVHHLVSVVTARLAAGLGPVDVLRAAFPGGSVTGAPKIRAMEIIDEIETARRGPYCGAILRIGHDGSMDSAIVIRTLVLAGRRVIAQAGGAVTALSDPAEEYREMRVKLAPLQAVFGA